jgi:endo-1,4-beta-mannosidase
MPCHFCHCGACRKRTCIHSWDICNEPRNKKTPNDNRAVGDWVHKVAEKIKETDHKSLVTIGSEGFFGPKGLCHIGKLYS